MQRILRKLIPIASVLILHGSVFAQVTLETTPTMRSEVKDLKMAVNGLHFNRMSLDEIDYQQLIVDYMEHLDFAHLYFRISDEIQWKARFGLPMKNAYLDKNEIYPAFYIFNTFQQRAEERLGWIRTFLSEPINLEQEDYLIVDDKNETWPATEQEADVRWTKQLKNEIISQMLPDLRKKIDASAKEKSLDLAAGIDATLLEQLVDPESFQTMLDDARQKVLDRYERWYNRITEIRPSEVHEDFLTKLAQMYDPHSNFMSPDTSEDFGIAISNELIGIGAVLSDENGYCKIQELVEKGPAEKSKQLAPGDFIVGVAQEDGEFVDVVGKRLRDIVRLIRGEESSLVRLKIKPARGAEEEKIVDIIRERITLEEKLASAEIQVIENGDRQMKIGIINLPSFYGPSHLSPDSSSASGDVERLIEKLQAQDVEGIILDLRTNGGGLLDEAIKVTGLFISQGSVVKLKDRRGNFEINRDHNPNISWRGPLAVLTSRYSASASEIVAGALQYYKRAVVIGDISTHGKGTVQKTYPLPISEFDFFQTREEILLRPRMLQRIESLLPAPRQTANPSIAKITIGKYYLPDGSSTQLKGVESDIVIPSVNEILPIKESDLDNPMPWDVVDGQPLKEDLYALDNYPMILPGLVEMLNSQSAVRRSELEEFQYLDESIKFFSERYNRDQIPLRLTERLTRIYTDKEISDVLEKRRDTLAGMAFESIPVVLHEKPAGDETAAITSSPNASDELDLVFPDDAASADGEDTEEEKDRKPFDIQKREAVRIMSDWILIENRIREGDQQRQMALAALKESMEKTSAMPHNENPIRN